MTDGVVYWCVGARHDEHLVVSLLSLRDHWKGLVTIVVGDDHSKNLAIKCALDLGAKIVEFDYAALKARYPGKTFYLAKCQLWDYVDYDRSVFLDLDTLVLGDITDLFPTGDEIRLTQFCGWTTRTPRIRRRVESWLDVLPREARWVLDHEVPAINTGVFGFGEGSRDYMAEWRRATAAKGRVPFMADELTAQCIYPWYEHVVLDDRWNWSPKLSRDYPDVRIAHGHGWKFHKTVRGRQLWEPVYRRAIDRDVAGIRSWTPTRKFQAYYGRI